MRFIIFSPLISIPYMKTMLNYNSRSPKGPVSSGSGREKQGTWERLEISRGSNGPDFCLSIVLILFNVEIGEIRDGE